MSLVHVFLYGTLKRSQPNYHWLTNAEHGYAKYICDAVTCEKFPLIIASSFNIPFLLNVPGKGHQIKGEVFEIDEKMLSNLDILEDYPVLYEREVKLLKLVATTNDDLTKNGEIIEGVTYYLKKYPEKLLELEFIDEYKDSQERSYQPKEVDDFSYEDLLKEVS